MLAVITDIEIGDLSRIEEFKELSKKMAMQFLQKEEGCHIFDIYRDLTKPSLFTLNEDYSDEQSFNRFRNSDD